MSAAMAATTTVIAFKLVKLIGYQLCVILQDILGGFGIVFGVFEFDDYRAGL